MGATLWQKQKQGMGFVSILLSDTKKSTRKTQRVTNHCKPGSFVQ